MPDQFWQEIEPREFILMLIAVNTREARQIFDRRREAEPHLILTRRIAMDQYNANVKKAERILNPANFFRLPSDEQREKERPVMTQERLRELDEKRKRRKRKT